jgi:hypothetical protein
MIQILVNDAFRALVPDLTEKVAFCDDSGNVLGYYVPANQPSAEVYAWAKTQVTREQLDRASKQTGGRTWQEIKRDLERLP